MAVAALLLQNGSIRRWFLKLSTRVYDLAARRNAFAVSGVTAGYRKLDLVRIGIGSLASMRYLELVQSSVQAGGLNLALSAAGFGLAIALTFGFCTPIASFALMVLGNTIIDNYLGASTLGSMVLSNMLLIAVLAPAGTTLSVDALLVSRFPKNLIGRFINKIYAWTGPTSEKRLVLAMMAGVLVYYMLCLYSVLVHMHDPAWKSGNVTAWILLSPVFNPEHASLIDSFYKASPGLFVELGRLSMYGMILWYLLFLPGLFMGKAVRTWVVYWSLAFWLISAFVLPLSYLGKYELFLWILLFFSHGFIGKEGFSKLTILFDDRCNLCAATVRFLKAVDLFFMCEFRPVSQSTEILREYRLSMQEALKDIVGIVPASKDVLSGYALYEWISGHLVLLWPLRAVLWLGRVLGLGPLVYRYVADRRTRLFGVCERADPMLPVRVESLPSRLMKQAAYPAYFYAVLLATLLFCAQFAARLPFTGERDTSVEKWLSGRIGASALVLGLGKINVFNMEDLNLGQVKLDLFVDGVAIQEYFHSASRIAIGSLSAVAESDAERYKIAGLARVNSRVNLRCNSSYINSLAPTIEELSRSVGTDKKITAKIYFVGGVSMADLKRHEYVATAPREICEIEFFREGRPVSSISYHQVGVDALMKSIGRRDVIRASGANMLEFYPCIMEREYFSTLFDRYGESLPNRERVLAAITNMNTSSYGEFELECVLELGVLNETLLREMSVEKLPAAVPGKCDLEAKLAKAYASTLRRAYASSREVTLEMQIASRLDAIGSLNEGDPEVCVAAFAAARQEFQQLLFK